MSGRFLLDTNIVIDIFADEPVILEAIQLAEKVFLPVIVIGELIYGAKKSAQAELNMKRIEDFCSQNTILHCDESTANHYGVVKNELRKKGRPAPENDIWIAAIALQHDLILVTRDSHFAEMDSVKRDCW